MGIRDKNLRQQAIPYSGQICGYNRSENSDQDISKTVVNPGTGISGGNPALLGNGDLFPLITGVSQTDYMIRILRPKFGQIIQAYLTVSLTFAATEPNPQLRISVGGSFATDTQTANVPNSTFISSCMNTLHPPSGNPFIGVNGQPLTLFTLNIQPLIPQVGSANYVADFYSVGLHFVSAPVTTGVFHLNKFSIVGSIMVT